MQLRTLVIPCTLLAMTISGCASHQAMGPDDAHKQLQMLMTLYKEDKPKFVIQKQKLQQDTDCSSATALRDAAKKWEDEANTQPGDSTEVSMLHSELDQAAKVCLAK